MVVCVKGFYSLNRKSTISVWRKNDISGIHHLVVSKKTVPSRLLIDLLEGTKATTKTDLHKMGFPGQIGVNHSSKPVEDLKDSRRQQVGLKTFLKCVRHSV